MQNDKDANPQAANVEAIASGISEVVNAAFGVGAAVFRTLAEATALGKPVPPGAAGEGPFADMIHYGVETASNVARLVIRGIPSTVRSTSAASGAASALAHPTVHAGSTLRIPLSIENPSDAEMLQMAFRCESLTYQGDDSKLPLTAEALLLQPATLSIAPHDFEKLTVFITTTEATATGIYLAKIALSGGGFESMLRFEVVPSTKV
ncbi:MAG: hypothetical protein WB992_22005 [Bryobacteraceae bacterium]